MRGSTWALMVALLAAGCGASESAPAGSTPTAGQAGASGQSAAGTGGAAGSAQGGQAGAPGGSAGAAGKASDGPDTTSYPDACAGLGEPAVYACAEQRFWTVFQVDFDHRKDVHDLLKALHDAIPAPKEPAKLAQMIFRRGQLGIALAIENGKVDLVDGIVPDFDRAIALDPTVGFYFTWRDSMLIARAELSGDKAKRAEAIAGVSANVARDPKRNIPSITGTLIGLPKSSGGPSLALSLLASWECHPDNAPKNPWCLENGWKAPYGAPGFQFHMGEEYARVGDKARATAFFEAALKAPGASGWAYRHVVEEKLADMDGYLKSFADLGDDGTAFLKVYANQKYGCALCHAK